MSKFKNITSRFLFKKTNMFILFFCIFPINLFAFPYDGFVEKVDATRDATFVINSQKKLSFLYHDYDKNTYKTDIQMTGKIQDISASWGTRCIIMENEDLYCWGRNTSGQLGIGTSGDNQYREEPTLVNSIHNVKQVATSDNHTCAVTEENKLYCWGANYLGQLGLGTNEYKKTTPTLVNLESVKSVAVGGYHTCAVTTDGVAYCWGENEYGEIGSNQCVGDYDDCIINSPTMVPSITNVKKITAGVYHTCALTELGDVYCWGSNEYGEIGVGSNESKISEISQIPSLNNIKDIDAGSRHTCVIDSTDNISCWGSNDYGQLGDGTLEQKNVPISVQGLTTVDTLSLGDTTTCVTTNGKLYCWGSNEYGELGFLGDNPEVTTPVEIYNGKEISVVYPKTVLDDPVISRLGAKKVQVTMQNFDKASLVQNATKANANFSYEVKIKKIKRLGKDKKDINYRLNHFVFKNVNKNTVTFKKLDKGNYLVKYRIIIKKGKKTKYTAWSKKATVSTVVME